MKASAIDLRTEYHDLIDRLLAVRAKLVANTGNARTFTFPDGHLLSEGILLTAWTHWEELNRQLFIHDLATRTTGKFRRDVKARGLRYKHSDARLAELIIDHPDENRFIEWNNADAILARADNLLVAPHRFSSVPAARRTTIANIKKVRNAIAHNSDDAWRKFIKLISNAPHNLTSSQRKGITVGRFITSHAVGATLVLNHFLQELRQASSDLVP